MTTGFAKITVPFAIATTLFVTPASGDSNPAETDPMQAALEAALRAPGPTTKNPKTPDVAEELERLLAKGGKTGHTEEKPEPDDLEASDLEAALRGALADKPKTPENPVASPEKIVPESRESNAATQKDNFQTIKDWTLLTLYVLSGSSSLVGSIFYLLNRVRPPAGNKEPDASPTPPRTETPPTP